MFDFPAWMDEVHIVEMGRNILDGGSCSILMQPDGSTVRPLYYLGPVLQELFFRAFGTLGPRLSSFLGLIALSFAFRWFLHTTKRYEKSTITLAMLSAFTMPLLIQSIRMVRIDCWVIAAGFTVCGLLIQNRTKSAAALAACTPFLWPSAVLLFPLYLAIYLERGLRIRDLAAPFFVFLIASALCILPIANILSHSIAAFVCYYTSVGHSAIGASTFSVGHLIQSNIVLLTKESLRAPFFCLLAAGGLCLAFKRRKTLVAMFILSGVLALSSGMHTFRFIYLTPFFMIFAADAIRLQKKSIKVIALLAISTGAAGLWTILRPHETACPDIIELLGEPPRTVLNPDYSTYYSLRKHGYRQVAIGDAGGYADANRIAKLLDKCDAVLVKHEDPYAAIEESLTPYGLLRDYCLSAARQESAQAEKSIPARIGATFAYGSQPSISKLVTTRGFTLRKSAAPFSAYARQLQ